MQLSTLLNPQSIAIIGASTQEGSVGWSLANPKKGICGNHNACLALMPFLLAFVSCGIFQSGIIVGCAYFAFA